MNEISTEVVVLGAGPGGYSAAFRLADLGKKVVLIERFLNLGGVCLNVGCIPSKALLHVAKVIDDAKQMSSYGVDFASPKIDIDKIRNRKNSIITKLTLGLKGLAKRRKVEIVTGTGKFKSANEIEVENSGAGKTTVKFENAIIAAGSLPVKLPFIPEDPRVYDSTDALNLKSIPSEVLIIGGGIIGLEMATVYEALGSKISIVEFMNQLAPGVDTDIIQTFTKYVQRKYQQIMLETKVIKVDAKDDGLWVTFGDKMAPLAPVRFDAVLVSVGRKPNGNLIGAKNAGINVDARGFIPVNKKMQTNVGNIYAIGDIIGNPMLAHKAVYEGRLTAEIIAGSKREFTAKCIPSVAYTDPEIAWVGVTENEAKQKNIKYGKGVLPWIASGRSQSLGRQEGFTKLIFTEDTKRIIGAGIIGPNAGELIAELGLAIEMNATADDIALTIHPHPTLSESIMMAAEVFEGTVTDI